MMIQLVKGLKDVVPGPYKRFLQHRTASPCPPPSPLAVKWNSYRPLLTQLTQCVNRSSLFTFIEEIRNRKLHFLCIVYDSYNYMGSELILVLKFTSYIAVNSDI